MIKAYVHQVLIAADQLVNALTGGWADETLSSRAFRRREHQPYKALRMLIDLLFFWQDEHCKRAYMSERHRRQFPPELRFTREK